MFRCPGQLTPDFDHPGQRSVAVLVTMSQHYSLGDLKHLNSLLARLDSRQLCLMRQSTVSVSFELK